MTWPVICDDDSMRVQFPGLPMPQRFADTQLL